MVLIKSFSMQKLKLAIPKPCHENWDTMLPEEKGKFCQSCAKTVFDFTKSSTDEIASIFKKNKGEKICGRFRREQLESIKIEIPESLLYTQMPFKKAFLLALLVVMGTTLFSCKDFNNDYQTLGKVIVVEDTLTSKSDTLKKTISIKNDSIKNKTCNSTITKNTIHPLKKSSPELPPPDLMGDIVLGLPILTNEKENLTKTNKEYYNLYETTQKPTFPGGEESFSLFIKNNLKLPDCITKNERILSSFIIDSIGNLKNIQIKRGKNEELNKEIIRVLSLSPKWIPGEINSKKVNIEMYYPIRIKLE